jgi:lipopolysaccharide/colanic/teichoic acid biosynthesis glycosyltransferase
VATFESKQDGSDRVSLDPDALAPRRISKQMIRGRLMLAVLAVDLLAIVAPIAIAAWVHLGYFFGVRVGSLLSLVLPLYCLIALQTKAFSLRNIIKAPRSMRKAFFALLGAFAIGLAITFATRSNETLSRVLVVVGCLSSGVSLIVARAIFADLAARALGGTPLTEIVIVDGVEPPPGCTATRLDVLGAGITPNVNDPMMLHRIGEYVFQADRVIISCRPERRGAWAVALKGAGVQVEVLAPELDALGAIGTSNYHGFATAVVAVGPLNGIDRVTKRIFDLAVAGVMLIGLLPLLAVVAIAIRLDSPGPVLFTQQRVGQGNRLFRMLKFRSMYASETDASASRLVTRGDPRVTRIGWFIRQTSIDELPQLFNVLKGEMSIVGPRPHATGALAGSARYWEVSAHYWNRHAVKPGLTGLAQVRGFRGNTETGADLLNRLQADLAYLESWTVWRDVILVLQTFRVLMHRNAF